MATKQHIELTAEQQDAYVKDPFHCPFCGSSKVLAGDRTSDGRHVWQNVDCEDCQAFWTEEYIITGIVNENDGCEQCTETFSPELNPQPEKIS